MIILSIIVVTYKSAGFIERCLNPLIPYINNGIEVIVWDNNSPDNTVDLIERNFPSVKIIASKFNFGFGRGNNEALKYCSGNYILLLNPDAFISDINQIWELYSRLEKNPSVAAVGPRLINTDGSHQVGDAGWRHNLVNSVSHFLFLHKIFGTDSLFVTRDYSVPGADIDVDWVCGACMLIRKDAISLIGGLDNGIFLYGEDVAWGESLRRAGRRVIYVPTVSVIHLQGATQKIEATAPYFSTKWLDALGYSIFERTSPLGFFAFRLIASTGFILRFLVAVSRSMFFLGVRRRFELGRAQNMIKYAKYAFQLKGKP